jgi:TonB family protein
MDIAIPPVKVDTLGTPDPQLVDAHSFGISVQAALGPKVLSGRGLTGRVLVAFSVGTDGALLAARIAQSSGERRLDTEALAIVGRATFPTPPNNFSTSQRTYISAFTFT